MREEAARLPDRLGEPAEPALREALKRRPSLEVRRRIDQLLARLESLQPPELARGVRAVEVLEEVGTLEARKLLEGLAEGIPEMRRTQEAKASLDRLSRRVGPAP